MTVIFRDEISIVRFDKVKHFQILNNTVYFDFFDGVETIKRDIEIIEVLA